MDQASASQAASCVRNPAAPRTSSSCSRSVGRSRTAVPPPARSAPQSGLHSEPVHIAPRSSSPALRRFEAKGHLLPDLYSGATGIPGRFSEGLLLRRLHLSLRSLDLDSVVELYTENDFLQLVMAAETMPTFLGGLRQLEDHRECSLV